MDDKADDKVWSPQDLRNASTSWNLAGDRALLHMLETMHKDFIVKTENTTGKLDTLLVDLEKTSLSLNNVNNRFMGLSNTQFVENRVQEDDIEIIKVPDKDTNKITINPSQTSTIKEKEKDEAMRQEISLEKVGMSLARLEGLCDRIHISPDTDSESDDDMSDEAAQRTVLRTNDIYSDRPLPYIIGSIKWQKKWHIGLKECSSDSDTEDGDDGNRKNTEREDEFSDTQDEDEIESANNSVSCNEGKTVQEKKRQMTLPIKNKTNVSDNNASSLTSTGTNNSTDTTDSEIAKINSVPKSFSENISSKKNVTDPLDADSIHEDEQKLPRTKIANASDFAAELARKLGSSIPARTGAVSQENERGNVRSRNESGNVATERSKNQNFDPGLSKLPDTRVTGNVFLDEPPPLDVYNEEKDDLFGNYLNNDDDEDGGFLSGPLFEDKSKDKKMIKSSGLFGERKSSNLDGLFDDLSGDKDTFNNSIIKNKNVSANVRSTGGNLKKEEPKQKSKGLFDDDYDDFDDFKVQTDNRSTSKNLFDARSGIDESTGRRNDNEIVNKNSSSVEGVLSKKSNKDTGVLKKETIKKESLFDYDDDDDDASSLFGGNQKFSDIKHMPISKPVEKNVTLKETKSTGANEKTVESKDAKDVTSAKNVSTGNKSLFGGLDDNDDDDDDIFASLKKSTIIKPKILTGSNLTIQATSTNPINTGVKQKSKGLFDNDSDGEDLFSSLKVDSTVIPAKPKTIADNSSNIIKQDDIFKNLDKNTEGISLTGNNSQSVKGGDNSLADILKSKRQNESSSSDSENFGDESINIITKTIAIKTEVSLPKQSDSPNRLISESKVPSDSNTNQIKEHVKDKENIDASHDIKESDDGLNQKLIGLPKPISKPDIAKVKPQMSTSGTIIKNDNKTVPSKPEKPEVSKLKPNIKSVDAGDKTISNIKKDDLFENADLFNSSQITKNIIDDLPATVSDDFKFNDNRDVFDKNKSLIEEELDPDLRKPLNVNKRSNSLFDDTPPPLDVVESFSKDVKDVNSLFDDEDDDSDDLFSKFKTKNAKNDNPSKGLFDDISPNIDDIITKKSSDFGLFNDEPPDMDNTSVSESKEDETSDMFADYPYYKTVNVISSSTSVTDPLNTSSLKNITISDSSNDNNIFSPKPSNIDVRNEITDNKNNSEVVDGQLHKLFKTNLPVADMSVKPIPSKSKPNIASAKPQIVSTKPEIVSKPDQSKSNIAIAKSDVKSAESKKPEITRTKPKVEPVKPDSSKTNFISKDITISKEESLKIDQNISVDNTNEHVTHGISNNSNKSVEKEIGNPSLTKAKTEMIKNESKADSRNVKDLWEDKRNNVSVERETDVISPTRTIGKLQTSNFNINVKALIPGLAPKLVKEISEEIAEKKAPFVKNDDDEPKSIDLFKKAEPVEIVKQTNSLPTLNTTKNDSFDQVDRRAPMVNDNVIKAVSFDTEANPGSDVVLSNTASKERVKIQVKRRPSSRRARQEAIRKSAIDVTISDDDRDKSFDDFTTSLPTSPMGEKSSFIENYPHVGSNNDDVTSSSFHSNKSNIEPDITIPTIDRAYKIKDDGENTSNVNSKGSNDSVSKPSSDLFSSLTSAIDDQLFKSADTNHSDDLNIMKESTFKDDRQKTSVDASKDMGSEKTMILDHNKIFKQEDKKEILPPKKKADSLFGDLDDDVDLFASGKNNKMKGSSFGGDNFEDDNVDIFASHKSKSAPKQDSAPLESSMGIGKKTNIKKPNVFDDLDDVPDMFTPKVKSSNVSKTAVIRDIKTKSKNLFGDMNKNEDGDLFFKPTKSKLETSSSQKSKSLFGDDDDDDFDIFNPKKGLSNKLTKQSTDVSVTKATATVNKSTMLSSAEITNKDPLSSFLDD